VKEEGRVVEESWEKGEREEGNNERRGKGIGRRREGKGFSASYLFLNEKVKLEKGKREGGRN
jgi:hypothetical protein